MRQLLNKAHGPSSPAPTRGQSTEKTKAASNGRSLQGEIVIPPGAKGIVLFAHGSGSSRFSPRNQLVAGTLRAAGLGTLLFDLLTAEEEQIDQHTRKLRFDMRLLAQRLVNAAQWVLQQPQGRNLKLGFFGSSTGGGAALMAAAQMPAQVQAVVLRGGRPDLAEDALPLVKCPTLMIVGEKDEAVLTLNQNAIERITAPKELVVIPGASHLFDEQGTIEQVARKAAEWFGRHLGLPAGRR